ncbi:PP2 domain-containing protein, partial [Acinetobacter baumannii]
VEFCLSHTCTMGVAPSHDIPPPCKEPQLPHNCDEILKHADSPVDRSSTTKLYEQLYAGVYLNKNKKKYWVNKETKSNCFTLFARDLAITWGEDTRYWRWLPLKESSDESFEIAELLNVCWLEIHGRLEMASLSPGTTYEVIFVVKLNGSANGWEVPVNVKLTLPDGTTQEHKENLATKPKDQWFEIRAGSFKASAKGGEMVVSIYEFEGGKWKKGLIIKGVNIKPKAA